MSHATKHRTPTRATFPGCCALLCSGAAALASEVSRNRRWSITLPSMRRLFRGAPFDEGRGLRDRLPKSRASDSSFSSMPGGSAPVVAVAPNPPPPLTTIIWLTSMAAKIGPHDDPVRTHEVGLGDITNTFENNPCDRDGLGAVSDSLGHLLSVT